MTSQARLLDVVDERHDIFGADGFSVLEPDVQVGPAAEKPKLRKDPVGHDRHREDAERAHQMLEQATALRGWRGLVDLAYELRQRDLGVRFRQLARCSDVWLTLLVHVIRSST